MGEGNAVVADSQLPGSGGLAVGAALRWRDYVLGRGGEAVFLVREASRRSETTAFVIGLGFDPRMLVGLRRVGDSLRGRLRIFAVGLTGTGSGQNAEQYAVRNEEELTRIVSGLGAELISVELPASNDRRRAGILLAQKLSRDISDSHVVVDISALPKSVYFPLVASCLFRGDKRDARLELQVLVTENPDLDDAIGGDGTLSASHFGGFQHGLNLETVPAGPRVWAPVLGRDSAAQLQAIYDRLMPTEICPILPFPARNPRRGDDLLLEYRQLLVDTFEVEWDNYIYADESNPFDLYRTLCRLHQRYRDSLRPLGESTVVVSTHASKTLSIGVLLAAYEKQLPVIAAGPAQHFIQNEAVFVNPPSDDVVTCLWLQGEPYRYE
jgi:hypothetical protein